MSCDDADDDSDGGNGHLDHRDEHSSEHYIHRSREHTQKDITFASVQLRHEMIAMIEASKTMTHQHELC
jgi:hypothetical protein